MILRNYKMLIKINNIDKSFDTVKVLNGINLQVSKSDIITVFGHSGVGKSTLLSIVSGMVIPDNGDINIMNIKMNQKNSSKLRKKYIGVLFQKNNLLPEFTVQDNILLPLIINETNYIDSLKRVEYLLNLLNLSNLKNRIPSTLSRGEYQRVSLLRSIANNPKIVIADEPTANLDENNCKQLLDLIVKLNRELNITFLIASHDKRFMEVSSKTYTLFDGSLK